MKLKRLLLKTIAVSLIVNMALLYMPINQTEASQYRSGYFSTAYNLRSNDAVINAGGKDVSFTPKGDLEGNQGGVVKLVIDTNKYFYNKYNHHESNCMVIRKYVRTAYYSSSRWDYLMGAIIVLLLELVIFQLVDGYLTMTASELY